jgi:hypothetical protein
MAECKGFPDDCPHLIEIPTTMSGEGGGVRCGCALAEIDVNLRGVGEAWDRVCRALQETQAAMEELREKIFGPEDSVIHACPPDGSGLTPCCLRPPGELPHTDRIAIADVPITCPGVPS